ncbi:MAG: hypothetical protein L0338_21830 [Acidobacteria bacterium]|nr:hypothetical protein [Acidobacteriota bacterium]
MGLWKRVEQVLWTGTVMRDYGPLSEGRHDRTNRTVSALHTHGRDGDRFVIKTSYKAFLAVSVQYLDLDRESAVKLKAALDDALTRMV